MTPSEQAEAAMNIKFCKTCQCETERYKCGRCKPCCAADSVAYRAANSEAINAKRLAYRLANKEKIAAGNAASYRKNIEKRKATGRAYAVANAEKANARKAAWRAANPEKDRAYFAKWGKENAEIKRVYHQNRRARKLESGGALSKDLVERLFKSQLGKCACCGLPLGKKHHLDHIMPLALGGEHADHNMQLLRPVCNMQKSAKHPVDFMQSRGFLL